MKWRPSALNSCIYHLWIGYIDAANLDRCHRHVTSRTMISALYRKEKIACARIVHENMKNTKHVLIWISNNISDSTWRHQFLFIHVIIHVSVTGKMSHIASIAAALQPQPWRSDDYIDIAHLGTNSSTTISARWRQDLHTQSVFSASIHFLFICD